MMEDERECKLICPGLFGRSYESVPVTVPKGPALMTDKTALKQLR